MFVFIFKFDCYSKNYFCIEILFNILSWGVVRKIAVALSTMTVQNIQLNKTNRKC
jgi:hypothetical protein